MGVGPAAVPLQDAVSQGSYGARPKTTGLARQTESAWVDAGPTELQPGAGYPPRIPVLLRLGMGILPTSSNPIGPVESTFILCRG